MHKVIFRAMYFIMLVVKGSAKTNPLFLQTKNVYTCKNPCETFGRKLRKETSSYRMNLTKLKLFWKPWQIQFFFVIINCIWPWPSTVYNINHLVTTDDISDRWVKKLCLQEFRLWTFPAFIISLFWYLWSHW